LLAVEDGYGKVDGRGVRIDLPLTHELLAEMVCSARETVTRAVDELEREGFVIREAGGYRVAVDAQLPCENSHGAARRAFLRSVRG
jgi:CRP-like cAMP-binding protein